MAKILRFQEPLRFEPVSYRSLDNLPVFIQDDSATSYDYFGITEFPTVLTAGRNLLSFTGTKNLVSGAEIAIEVLDANGSLIPVRTYDHIGEGNERVFSIEVDETTPEGDALITLVSVAKGKVAFDRRRQRDLSERVPRNYENTFNIRWQKRLNCYPRRRNTDPISFFPNPDITVEEVKKPYFELTYNQRLLKFGTAHATASVYFDNDFQVNDELKIQLDVSGSPWRFIASDPFSTPEDVFPIIFWPTASTLASSVEELANQIEASPVPISASYSQISGVDYIHMTASYMGTEANSWTVHTGSHSEWTSSAASASFRFANSASNGSIIRLISDDGTTKSYYATSSAASAGDVYNGFNLYHTGSSKFIAARNLSQSISHVNGHNNKISASANYPSNGYVNLWMQHPAANGAGHQNGNKDIFTQSFIGTHADGTDGLASWNATFENSGVSALDSSVGFPMSFSGGLQSGSEFIQSKAQQFQGGAYQNISGGSNTKASYTLCSANYVGGWREQTGSSSTSFTPISGAFHLGTKNTSTKLRYEVEGDKYFVYVAGDVGADFGGFTEDMVGGILLFPEPNNPTPSSFLSAPGTELLIDPVYNEKERGDGHAFYSASHGSASVHLQGAYDTFIMERISPFQVRVNSPHTTFQGLTRAEEREVFHQKFDESDFRLDWAQQPISHSNSMNQVFREGGRNFFTSYAKIEFNSLTPLVGDITRIKTYMRNDQTVNDFIMLGDNPVFAQEMLIQSQSQLEKKPAGDFSKFGFSNYEELYNYWEVLGPPSASNNNFIMESPDLTLYNMQTVALNNPIKESLQVGDGVFSNTVYNLNGDDLYTRLFSKVPIEYRKDQYYQLEFNAYCLNINNEFGTPNLEIYIDGPALNPGADPHGKKIGEIKDINNRELIVETDYLDNKKFKPIKFTFKADATEYGYLLFKINRGLWYFSDISIKPYSQFGHTPHRFDVILPTQKADVRKFDAIDFRFEFYNDDHKKAVYTSEIHNVEFENVYSLVATNAFFQKAEIKQFIGETPIGDNDWAYAAIGTSNLPSSDPFNSPGSGVTYMPSITGSIFHHGRVGIGSFYNGNWDTPLNPNPPGPDQGLPIFDDIDYTYPSFGSPGWDESPISADLHVRKIQSNHSAYSSQGENHSPFGSGDAVVLIENLGNGNQASSILRINSDAIGSSGSSQIQFRSRGGVSQSVIGSTNIPNTDPAGNTMDGVPGGSFVIHDNLGDVLSLGVRGNSRFHIANGLGAPHDDDGSNVVLIGHKNPSLSAFDHRLDVSGSQIIRSGTLWLPDAYVYPTVDQETNDPPYILGTDSTHSVVKILHSDLIHRDDDWYISAGFISQSRVTHGGVAYGKMVGIFDNPYGTTMQGSPQEPSINSLILNVSQSGLVSKVRFEGIPDGNPTDVIGVDAQGMLYLTGSELLSLKQTWYDARFSGEFPTGRVTMSHDVAVSGSIIGLGEITGVAAMINSNNQDVPQLHIKYSDGFWMSIKHRGHFIGPSNNNYRFTREGVASVSPQLFIAGGGVAGSTLTPMGYIGMGTETPDANLHISGTLHVGSGSSIGHITASGDISTSGTMFLTPGINAGQTDYQVLVRDPGDGQVYYTGSYGVGGTGGSSGATDLDWVKSYSTTSAPTANSMSIQHSGSIQVGYGLSQIYNSGGAAIGLVSGNASPRTGETWPALIVRGRIEQDLGNSNFHNIAIGLDAMVSASLGPGGANGLGLNVTGMHYNTVVGSLAARAANNYLNHHISIGHYSGPQPDSIGGPMTSLTQRNITIGNSTGTKLNGGDDNVIIGNSAGSAIIGGGFNTFVGAGSGDDVTSGGQNVFLGYNSGHEITTGDGNIYIGYFTGYGQSNASNNLVIGTGALNAASAPIGGTNMNGSQAKISIRNKLGVGITPDHALDIVRGPDIEDFLDPVRVQEFRDGPGHILVWNEDNHIIYRTKNYISGQGGPNFPHLVFEQKSPTLQILSGSIQFVPASATTESNSGLFNDFHTEVKSDPLDISSFVITGSSNAKLYLSGSGKIGIGTTDPQEQLDLRADTFQLQRQAERKGIKLNAEGNIETFDNTEGSAATGSEIIINYSRGVTITAESLEAIVGVPFSSNAVAEASFSADFHPDEQTDILKKAEEAGFLNPPQTGDTLGAIRWVAASGSNDGYASRIAGEAANITALVSDIDETGVKGDLSFRVAGKTGAPVQKLLLDANDLHEMTGSLLLTGNISVTSNISHRQDSDTYLGFSNDNVHMVAGGEIVAQSLPSQFTIGDGGNIDLQVKAVGDQYNLFSDGGNAKVGIGTSAPSEKLTVVGNISASGNIYTDTNIIATGSIEALGNVTAVSFIGNATGLTGTPNITVGNISATSITTLNLTSSFITSSTIQTSGSNVFGDDLSDTHTFIGHVTASGNIIAIGDIAGVTGSFDYVKTNRLQVGAAEGTDILSIDGGDLQLENGKQITFADIGDGNTGRVRIVGNEDNDTISMHVDNSTSHVLALTTTGVGIGTTTPSEKLQVVGNISASGHISSSGLYVESSTITDFIKLNSLGSSANPIKLIFEKAAAEQGIIEYNRNGDLEIYNTDADGGVMIDGSTSAGGDFYVANSGNVGMGTTTPSEKLEVEGNISASGNGIFANVKIPHNGEVGYDSNNHLSFGSTSVGVDATVFNVNASNRINFHDANVGIRPPDGTTVAPEALTVEGNISASGNIISEGNVTADYYNSTTSVTGFKLNGAKYLWITDSDLQVGNDSVDTDIIGTSINLQSPVTASIIRSSNLLTTEIDVASADGFTINGEAATEAISWPVATLSTTTQMVATTDDAEFFVALADGASGAQVIESSTKLKQNPSTGKLTVSGEIAATSFIGQRVNIAYGSSNIATPTQNKYFYGGSNGLVSNTWTVQVSDPTEIPPQYINNLHIIPCGVKDVTLKSNSRCGHTQNPTIWIYTGSIDDDSNSNISMGFAASQSIHGITGDGETNGSGQHSYHMNITGSKSFTPNPGHELMAVFMKNEGTGTQAWRFNYRLDGITTE